MLSPIYILTSFPPKSFPSSHVRWRAQSYISSSGSMAHVRTETNKKLWPNRQIERISIEDLRELPKALSGCSSMPIVLYRSFGRTLDGVRYTIFIPYYRLIILTRYCDLVELEPQTTLIECCAARAENFLHWVLKSHSIKKVSSVETYWHQLSQLYIKWKGQRMEPLLMKKIYAVRSS